LGWIDLSFGRKLSWKAILSLMEGYPSHRATPHSMYVRQGKARVGVPPLRIKRSQILAATRTEILLSLDWLASAPFRRTFKFWRHRVRRKCFHLIG